MRSAALVVVALAGCSGGHRPAPKGPPPLLPGSLVWGDDGSALVDASGPLVIEGDRLIWRSADGGVRAAPLAGGPATLLRDDDVPLALDGERGDPFATILGDRGEAIAADDRSTVVVTSLGLLVEISATDGSAWVKSTSAGHGAVAMTAETIYASVPGIRRFARGPERMTVLALPRGELGIVALAGDSLYYLDAEDGGRVMRVPRRGGASEVVRAQPGADLLAVHGDHVITFDPNASTLDAGGAEPLLRDVVADAIAVDDGRVYWLAATRIMAAPLAGGGAAELLYESAPTEDGWAGADPPATLIVQDGVIVAASYDLPGVVQIDTRPGKLGKDRSRKPPPPPPPKVLAPGATDVAMTGDRLLAWTPDGLVVIPGDRVLPLPDKHMPPESFVADARDAWVVHMGELLRAPLDGGAVELITHSLGAANLAVDDDAVYVSTPLHEVVLRYARQ